MTRFPELPLYLAQARLEALRQEAERERAARALLLQGRASGGESSRLVDWVAQVLGRAGSFLTGDRAELNETVEAAQATDRTCCALPCRTCQA